MKKKRPVFKFDKDRTKTNNCLGGILAEKVDSQGQSKKRELCCPCWEGVEVIVNDL